MRIAAGACLVLLCAISGYAQDVPSMPAAAPVKPDTTPVAQEAAPVPPVAPSPQAVSPDAAPMVVQDVPGLRRREDQVMTLQSTARLVELDVVVTDGKGRSVKGLTAQDFVLTEDGAHQTLAGVVEHTRISADDAARAAAKMQLPPNTYSNYGRAKDDGGMIVFLIDALDNQVIDQMRLRQYMISYLKTKPVGTRMAIFELDTQMHMIQGFSSDPAVLLAAVESKRDSPGFSPVLENPAAGRDAGVTRDPLARAGRGSGETQNNLKRVRSEILKQGMQALGRYLSGFPGRKSLVWFTGDIPVWPLGAGPGAGPGGGFNDQFADQTSFLDGMNETTEVLRLNQIAVYPVDARGLTAGGGGQTQILQHGTLADVAAATGGKAFYNTNGLTEAMVEVADEATHYYTLSFSPSNRVFDGGYRRLKVVLTPPASQPGVQLAYRPGYIARNDDAELAQHRAQRKNNRGPLTVAAVGGAPVPATAIDAAMPLGSPGRRDVLFFAQVKPGAQVEKASTSAPLAKDNYLSVKYRKGSFREYEVRFAVKGSNVELVPAANGTYHGRMEFVTVVYDDQGQEVNSKVTKASVDPDRHSYPQILLNGVQVTQTVAVPAKGNFFLRLGVHDVTSDKAGTLEIPVGEIKMGIPVAAAAKGSQAPPGTAPSEARQ